MNLTEQLKRDGNLLVRPTKEKKPKRPLPSISKNPKVRGNRLRYFKLARTFKRKNPICQHCKSAPTQDVHHTKGRGKYLNDVSTFMALCRKCHDWCHAHPREARQLKLLA